MKCTSVVMLLVALLSIAPALHAQRDGRSEIVVVHEKQQKDFFAIRIGAWFPKDVEKGFTFDDFDFNSSDSKIDQSQAIGLEFHYRNRAAHPFYMDFSIGGWYSTYLLNPNAIISNPAGLLEASSWVAIVPITLGASFTVLPDNPVMPYLMAGAGAYVGISGTTVNYREDVIKPRFEEEKTLVRFGWYFGAGVDIFLTPGFGVTAAAKYHMLKFQEKMFTQQQDFTGLQLMVGIATAL